MAPNVFMTHEKHILSTVNFDDKVKDNHIKHGRLCYFKVQYILKIEMKNLNACFL